MHDFAWLREVPVHLSKVASRMTEGKFIPMRIDFVFPYLQAFRGKN